MVRVEEKREGRKDKRRGGGGDQSVGFGMRAAGPRRATVGREIEKERERVGR